DFAVRFAVPMLLFAAIYRLDLGAVFDWRLLVGFYTGAVACFVLAIVLSRAVWGRRPGEAVAIGFCALFSNSVLLGLPIMTRAYGADALAPNYAILSIHAPTCYLLGIFTMEFSRRDGAGPIATIRRAASAMFSNALTIGLALGFAANFSGVVIPRQIMNAVDMMATAALPAALFGLGGALTRYSLRADLGVASMAAFLSIVVHPAIAYGLTHHVFALPEGWVRAAVVTAAMPTGMNGYVFAAMYGRAQGAAASTVVLGTGCAVVSVTFWLWLLGGAATGG
ncbi:MAG: AEC family transporter, partial [Rubrimonas sp.]